MKQFSRKGKSRMDLTVFKSVQTARDVLQIQVRKSDVLRSFSDFNSEGKFPLIFNDSGFRHSAVHNLEGKNQCIFIDLMRQPEPGTGGHAGGRLTDLLPSAHWLRGSNAIETEESAHEGS